MKRTQWFNADVLPVRPGVYEWRCHFATANKVLRASYFRGYGWWPLNKLAGPVADCRSCQWRGLTAQAKEQK